MAICAPSLSCCSAWPWQKLMYKQVTINTPTTYLPVLTNFTDQFQTAGFVSVDTII